MQEGALTCGGCIWSLMDLNALRFLSTPCWLCCFSCGGSIGSKFRFTSLSNSYGTLVLTNLPFVFLVNWNINSYMENRTTPTRNKNNSTKKG